MLLNTDLRQSDLWAEYMESLGWAVDRHQNHYAYTFSTFGIHLSKILRFNSTLDIEQANQFFKEKNSLFAKLEPDFSVGDDILPDIKKSGFVADKWALAPTKTICIDLSKPLEDTLKGFEKDTRYSIRFGEKTGLRVEVGKDFDTFYPLYLTTAKRNKFWTEGEKNITRRWEIFSKKDKAQIFIAYLDKDPLATAMVYYWDKTAYYLYAGSSAQKREFLAPYTLIWEIIKDSKKRGYKFLDLEGVVDSRIPSTASWEGFSHFKKGFRGETLTSVGTFTKVYNPILSPLFQLANRAF